MQTSRCLSAIHILFAPALALLAASALVAADGPAWKLPLAQDWTIQSSAKVVSDGSAISTAGFNTTGWYPTKVPSTVLAALVRDHVYPDPDFGINLRAIPGAAYSVGQNFSELPMPEDSPFRPAWWYRTEFRLPAKTSGRKLWLHFDGVNYRADVWLNGHRIAGSNRLKGTWRQFEFEVSKFARYGAPNTLALKILAPAPDDLSLTFVDWNPLSPDKDMGIFGNVYLTSSGPVSVRNAQVITNLDVPSLSAAHLTIAADVRNATDRPVDGELRAQLENIVISQYIHLAALESRRVVFAPDVYRALNISHPRIWWPRQYGAPNLYRARLKFLSHGRVSDSEDVEFGIRKIASYLDGQNHRFFVVNGLRILIRGAGWAPDMLLRQFPQRDEQEIRYISQMHLNTIRLEGKLMDDHLLNLCDRYGILVIAGWCCCSHWERWKSWGTDDYSIAAKSLRDQLRRLRNHPCILTWLNGSDLAPPVPVERMYERVLKEAHWPNPYQSSSSGHSTPNGQPTGFKHGPYGYEPPSYWYKDKSHGGAFGFDTETGPGPAIPSIDSIREMLPRKHWWPIDSFWNYHAWPSAEDLGNLTSYTRALESRYGKAEDIEDYVEKSQVMAYESERAMFEAYSQNKYTSTGVIQWMLNSAWPSMYWHLFDYYLRPGGGYFGTKRACEPLHVQYSYDDRSVVVVNSLLRSFSDVNVRAEVYNIDLEQKFSREVNLDVMPDSSQAAFFIPKLKGLSSTYFVRLLLKDGSGKIVSQNFYWLSTKPDVIDWKAAKAHLTPLLSFADFSALANLPKAALEASFRTEGKAGVVQHEVTIQNPNSQLAFFIHLKILKGSHGGDVHPIYWEDNDFELMPHEKRRIAVTYQATELEGKKPVLAVRGWNVAPFTTDH